MEFIVIDNVWKNLAGEEILRGVNLRVKKGEIMALVGPSGSGKTTLLKCINRLMDIDKGDIIIDGKSIYSMEPVKLRRRVCLVHQESPMLPGTVYDNISYGLRLIGEEHEEKVISCMEEVNIPLSYLEKSAEKLSGGERQRVALARAVILEPEILLLDEPTTGIDPKRIKYVEKMILSLVNKMMITVIWVTHDVMQAMRVGTKIANIKDGKIKQLTSPEDFKWGGAY